ncbi:Putative Pre-mRNA polyadenylation factor fip1 [[Torrubiella] hemipterigena]|uniref:Putative Pre-mRNA polyadenylation factor fip1 n=1 Tax=[Torrubiella] hemipterigena TaxID=1531966 RepID=A0A0A1T6H1_9HYPO|nr:Putative Pre-mRNA polyadenylation factor fip1 [[Torrubiella] hemipterigena]
MDMDEDDDIYVPEEPIVNDDKNQPTVTKTDNMDEGDEDEGAAMDEDNDSDDDSDIDIITVRKDGTKAEPPSQSKYSDIRNIPQRTTSNDTPVQATPTEDDGDDTAATTAKTAVNLAAPSADQASAAASKSTIDINANPIYPAAGKPITQLNIDEDLGEHEKPWRKPGTDITDYFNYGFDEFTWALYAAKQDTVRGEFGADAFANNNKKMMDDFNNMMMMGGMGMGGAAGGSGAQGGNMQTMEGMPPEMQQMMQQMMASGMDPSQMDMSQMFNGMQNGGAAVGAQENNQNYTQGGYAGSQQGQGYGGSGGYNQNMGGGGARGGYGGGRGRRGRW